MAKPAELITLRQLSLIGIAIVSVFPDHKRISQFDVKIGLVSERIGKSSFVFLTDNTKIQMRTCLHFEDKEVGRDVQWQSLKKQRVFTVSEGM